MRPALHTFPEPSRNLPGTFPEPSHRCDRLYGWQKTTDGAFVESIEQQSDATLQEFESRSKHVLLQLAEQGLNAELYHKNKDFREYVSLVPTSAFTGERSSGLGEVDIVSRRG